MKKLKKQISFLLAVLMLSTSVPISAIAEQKSTAEPSLYESLLSSNELRKIDDVSMPYEVDYDLSVDMASKIDNNDILDELSIDSNSIIDFNKIMGDDNNDICFEATFNDGSVIDYNEELDIVSYSNFNREKNTMARTNDDIIDAIKSEYNIDSSYSVSVNADNGDSVYCWERKDIENNCINIYDSLTIRVDGETNDVVLFNRFDDSYESSNEQIISEQKAKEIALNVNNKFNKISSCEKEYVKPNFYWNNDHIAYEKADVVRLVYSITIDDLYIVQVDAYTGEIIGGDMIKAANNAGTFAYNGFNTTNTAYATLSRNLAKTAFSGLGYTNSSTLVGDTGLRSKVLSFVTNDTKAYGFYIDCHGNSTTLATDSMTILRSSEVTGNWHFVFLDACETAVNTTWANAFKINNNYTKRAFLGWSNTVTVGNGYDFCKYFWPETTGRNHSNNIRDAAVWAASKVPGSGTTPIRFYGDKTYNGRSY